MALAFAGACGLPALTATAAPFLSVDFNTNASATQTPDFVAFTGGAAATSIATPVSASFAVTTPAVTSNSVTIRIAGDATVNGSGDLSSSANNVAFNTRAGLTNSGAFTYADLYRDFVYTNVSGSPTYIELSGLNANTPYSVTLYPTDPNSAKTTTITNVTGGGSTAFGAITTTAAYTSNEQYAVTNFATSDGGGRLIFRASTSTFATINGLRIDVPEPGSASILTFALPMLFRRRRR